MSSHTPFKCSTPLYDYMVGTGGIGSGLFFLLEGNQTLSRNESRLGRQLTCRDYCKQHTILHYVSVLMGAGSGTFEVYPIGKVGDDDRGWSLLAEMDSVGMITSGVTATRDAATLFSVCFQYPDSTGGNITTSNGASCLLTAGDIANYMKTFRPHGSGMVLAVPEVPLEARIALLMEGRKRNWFNASSISANEAIGFVALGGLELSDLLAMNKDEAAAMVGADAETVEAPTIVGLLSNVLAQHNPAAMLIITDGPRGCWACIGDRRTFVPPLAVDPLSTAGAGDALLAGTLCGLACGLPFIKDSGDNRFSDTPLDSAVELGTLLASLSVTSPDTIHWGADALALRKHAAMHGVRFSERFSALFPDRKKAEDQL